MEQPAQQRRTATIHVKCDPSLKADMEVVLIAAGFRSITDLINTFARDFRAGRIKYKQGILLSQAEIT